MRALTQCREGQPKLMASLWQPANRGPPGSLMMGCPRQSGALAFRGDPVSSHPGSLALTLRFLGRCQSCVWLV